MPITITSKRDGFRRCGLAHPACAVTYPDDAWTPEQLAQLKAEPNLIVVETSDEGETDDKAKAKTNGKAKTKDNG